MTKRKPKQPREKGAGGGRFSARRKAEAVRRLVAGEDLDVLARELGVTAATLREALDAQGVPDRVLPWRAVPNP